jgi:hypothetical protein
VGTDKRWLRQSCRPSRSSSMDALDTLIFVT